jgi:hypothetical protein
MICLANNFIVTQDLIGPLHVDSGLRWQHGDLFDDGLF